ncbi:hypothetical protein ACRAWD_07880 [Caulobacter segnis]
MAKREDTPDPQAAGHQLQQRPAGRRDPARPANLRSAAGPSVRDAEMQGVDDASDSSGGSSDRA